MGDICNIRQASSCYHGHVPRAQLDDIDLKILGRLQEEARISNVELADEIGLSPAPCLRRVRELEEAGIIRKYVTLLEPSAVNLGVTVFVQISLDLQLEGRLEIFEQAIMQRPEVLECYLMTGDADYLVRVVVPDVPAYERFLRDFLTRVESVAGIKSSFALKQVKYLTALPIPRAPSSAQPIGTSKGRSRTKRRRSPGTPRK
jgi:Lrp/AsnC family leucine-responsive transcriptional regulator